MISAFVLMAILGGISVLLLFFGLPEWAVYLALGVRIAVLAVPGIFILNVLAAARYRSIEA